MGAKNSTSVNKQYWVYISSETLDKDDAIGHYLSDVTFDYFEDALDYAMLRERERKEKIEEKSYDNPAAKLEDLDS